MSKITVPTDFGRTFSNDMTDLMNLAIREAGWNAQNYNATLMRGLVAQRRGKRYLIIGHNGEPFENAESIRENGCTPQNTEGRDSSLNGVGLPFIGSVLKNNGGIIVGSHCKDGNWAAYAGYPNFEGGSNWERPDVSQEWHDRLQEIWGEDIFAECQVYYVWKLAQKRSGSGRLLAETTLNNLPFIAPDLVGKPSGKDIYSRHPKAPQYSLNICMSEQEFGENDTVPKQQKRTKNAGAWRRYVVSKGEYLARYQDREFRLQSQPFDFEIDRDNGIYARFEDMQFVIRTMPVKKTTKSSHFATIRSDSSWNFDKNSSSYPGMRPKRTVFAYFPVFAQSNEPAFKRYKTDACYMTSDIRSFMQSLGLRAPSGNDASFLILEVYVNKVKKVEIDENGKETVSYFDAMELASYFMRKPDFTNEYNWLNREICKRGAETVLHDENWREVDECLKEMFPVNERQLATIDLGLVTGAGDGNPTKRNRYYDFYNVDTGEPLDRMVDPGDVVRFAILNRETRQWVNKSSVFIPSRLETSIPWFEEIGSGKVKMLGKKVQKNIEAIKQHSGADPNSTPSIFGLEISDMYALYDDEHWYPIAWDEYDPSDGSCIPRRNLPLSVDDAEYPFLIANVPKMARQASSRQSGGRGDGQGKEKQRSPYGVPYKPYCDRDEHFLVELRDNEKFVRINQNTKFAHENFYFEDSRIQKYIVQLYWFINCVALSLRRSNKYMDTPDIPNEEQPENEPYKEDNVDYPLNQMVRGLIEQDETVHGLIERISNKAAEIGLDQPQSQPENLSETEEAE